MQNFKFPFYIFETFLTKQKNLLRKWQLSCC